MQKMNDCRNHLVTGTEKIEFVLDRQWGTIREDYGQGNA